uniref:Uncharacterized protein n=1 Tax=Tetranychus urticae TaxID=32264 RepID=T1JXV7_TETUR
MKLTPNIIMKQKVCQKFNLIWIKNG